MRFKIFLEVGKYRIENSNLYWFTSATSYDI